MTPTPMTRPRLGVDPSLLADRRATSAARWLAPALRELARRDAFELVTVGGRHPDRRPRRFPRHLRLDGFHSFTSGFPLGGGRGPRRRVGPLVQTVHELPWRHGVAEGADRRHRAWVALGARYATCVVCPTEHVRRDLLAARTEAGGGPLLLAALAGASAPRAASAGPGTEGPDPAGVGGPPVDVRVLPWGVDAAFRAPCHGPAAGPPRLVLPLAGRTKKRAVDAVRALPHLDRDVRLALTGPSGPGLDAARRLATELGVEERLELFGTVADDGLPALYATAAAVLCLAASEGFCLPVAEALSVGTPPVVPTGGAQAEVGGGHAVECPDPSDPAQLARAIERALDRTPRAREAGRAFAARYTWEAWGERAVALWRELLGLDGPGPDRVPEPDLPAPETRP